MAATAILPAARPSTIGLTATGTATTLALGANPASSTFGQSVTLTATLSTSAVSTNGESINFYNGAGLIGSGTLASGVATLTLSTLPAGTDSLTAAYVEIQPSWPALRPR